MKTPNNDEVICPQCCNQFHAIPVNVQKLMIEAGFEPPFTHAPQPLGAQVRRAIKAEDALRALQEQVERSRTK